MKKNRLKKTLAVLAAFSVVMLSACSGGQPETTAAETEAETTAAETTPEETTAAETTTQEAATETETEAPAPRSLWEAAGPEAAAFAAGFDITQVVRLHYVFAGEGGEQAYFTENPETIQKVFDALSAAQAVELTTESAEDYADRFTFELADGSAVTLSFNMHHLEGAEGSWVLQNDTDIWMSSNGVIDDQEARESAEAESAAQVETFTDGMWTYTVAEQPEGGWVFTFNDAVVMTFPEAWAEVNYECRDNYVEFYHEASRDKFVEEYGEEVGGGWLMSLCFSENKDFEEFPNYKYLGTGDGGYYFLDLPTDVQGYMDGGEIWDEWQELMSYQGQVIDDAVGLNP